MVLLLCFHSVVCSYCRTDDGATELKLFFDPGLLKQHVSLIDGKTSDNVVYFYLCA